MFRRPGKNPLDENYPSHEDSPLYKGHQQEAPQREIPSRVFEPHPTSGMHSGLPTQPTEPPLREESTMPLTHHFQDMLDDDSPETTLGEGVTFRGELSFEKLLKIDGTFEGELLSEGKVVVGPKGKVKANLTLREAVIEGEVEGNIRVEEKLELRGEAIVKGDIQAKVLTIDPGVKLRGHVTIDLPQETSTY